MMGKKYAIFGAGQYGKLALKYYKPEQIECFVDNDTKKWYSEIESIPIIGLAEYIAKKRNCEIVIATKYAGDVIRQLEDNGIYDYHIYIYDISSYYPEDVLIYNPYEREENALYEGLRGISGNLKLQEYIDLCVDSIKGKNILFGHVEIETYNRCNGGCEFCPVSVKNESRPECKMEEKLFKKIINELGAMNYDGRLALFSNNEPFLDDRILDFHKYARAHVPHARMHLFTNGTRLSIDKFIEVMQYLDELIIDNYSQNLDLLPNCRDIKAYCETHPELIGRVTIVLRKPQEILTSRGGDAPNKKEKNSYADAKCILPFRQLIIRPDGKVSLCCNDPFGKNTLGDTCKDSLIDIWNNDRFRLVRKCLAEGRGNWKHCEYCDTVSVG